MSFKHLLTKWMASTTSFLETDGLCLFHIFLSFFRFFVLNFLKSSFGFVYGVLSSTSLSSVMHPGWISNQWTPGSENFTRKPRSPTKTKKKKKTVPRCMHQIGWPCLSIRKTRTEMKPTAYSPSLQSLPSQWQTLGIRWGDLITQCFLQEAGSLW